jgi:hypothetical protein
MKLNLKNISAATLLVGALVVSSTTANAQSTTMDALAAGGNITVGDLVFYNFQNVSQVGNLSLPLSTINVVAYTDVNGNSGIEFQPNTSWSIQGALQSYDLSFNFKVTTTSGLGLIEDDTLQVTGGEMNSGALQIAEGVTDTSANTLANSYVYITDASQKLMDNETFTSPQTVINVSKDFSMNTGDNELAQAYCSHFTQSFSEVPEPTTMALAGLGGLGLLLFRRRN